MKAGMKRKWVAALRSDKYRQGTTELKYKNDEGTFFCCLGVLRDLYPAVRRDRGGGELLSPATCGLSKATQESLAQKNDSGHYSFEDIADFIESNTLR